MGESSSLLIEDEGQSGCGLNIYFSGFGQPGEPPVFNFKPFTEHLPGKKIYIRDFANRYFLRGIPEIPGGGSGLMAFLSGQVREQALGRCHVWGFCSGGHPAIRLSLMEGLPCTVISPLIDLRPARRLFGGEWNRQSLPVLLRMLLESGMDRDWLNLLNRSEWGKYRASMRVFYGRQRSGRRQALLLKGKSGVSLHEVRDLKKLTIRYLFEQETFSPQMNFRGLSLFQPEA